MKNWPEIQTEVKVLKEETYEEKIKKPSDLKNLADNFIERYMECAYKMFSEYVYDEFDESLEDEMRHSVMDYDHCDHLVVLEWEVKVKNATTYEIHWRVTQIGVK